MDPHAEGTGFEIAFTENEHRVDLGFFGAEDLSVDFIGGGIDLAAHAVGTEFGLEDFGGADQFGIIADGEDAHLFWGKPEREVAAVMFDQESDEALVRAEGGTMDAEGSFLGVVAVFVNEPEAFWDGEVDLIGGDGELASDGAPELDVDLGAVERGFVGDLDVVDAGFDEDVADHVFGLLPKFGFVDEFFAESCGIVGGEAHEILSESEDLEVFEVHLVHGHEFSLELIRGEVEVGVVHLHGTDAHEAEEFAGLFVAVTGAVFCEAQGQVPVAARHGLEDLVVVRAVHSLEVITVGDRLAVG